MNDLIYPKLLILSNVCLCDSDSNGRTLKNFLVGWPKDKIAQFFIHGDNPDFDICENYYNVTDRQALSCFCGKKRNSGGPIKYINKEESVNADSGGKVKKSLATVVCREIVWNSRRWENNSFDKWLTDFSPEIILLQAGDSVFMLNLARELSERFNIPLVMYNSEVYYFKDFNYFHKKGIFGLFYPVYCRYFRKQFDKALKCTKHSVYATEAIKKLYDNKFNMPSDAIYTVTFVEVAEKTSNGNEFLVSYAGNLGVGRHLSLIEIAECLQKIDKRYKLDIYGKTGDDEIKSQLINTPGIRYNGFVTYDEVLNIMQRSSLIVHVESFLDYYVKDSMYAFSTKIADSLGIGVPFLMYAPEEITCSKYIEENSAAYVAHNKEDLCSCLQKIIDSEEARNAYTANGRALAENNHNPKSNSVRFQRILINAVYGTKKEIQINE